MNLIRHFNNLSFTMSAVTGLIIFLVVNVVEQTPAKIKRGQQAQAGIQLLDEMRRPILKLKKAEFLKLPSNEQYLNFQNAIKDAETLIKKYQKKAAYNQELLVVVKQLADKLDRLIIEERDLWQKHRHPLAHHLSNSEMSQTHEAHHQTINRFFQVLDVLALGEHPLHKDIAEGQAASSLLNWSAIILTAYLLLLIILFQKKRNTELTKQQSVLEKHVKERTHALEVANKELESFAYSVSHDLRAPLRSIDGFSQVLLEDCSSALNTQCKDYLQRIRASSQKMGDLIDDMLQLSRLTRNLLNKQNINLTEIVKTITDNLKQSQPERNVQLQIEDNLEAFADLSLAEIVLTNLLENAWKYSANETVTVIKFGQTEKGDEFYIKDNGVGFNNEYKAKLFTPFQRLHGKEFEGNGIGLATVKRIIDRHGGSIRADARINKGSTFYFSFG